MYIIKVWSTWSTRSLFANGRNGQSISFSRLFFWHSEDVTTKFQLAVPNQMNQRYSVSHGIAGGVQNMANALYIQYDTVAWGSKGVDFTFHVIITLFYYPERLERESFVSQYAMYTLGTRYDKIPDMVDKEAALLSFENKQTNKQNKKEQQNSTLGIS